MKKDEGKIISDEDIFQFVFDDRVEREKISANIASKRTVNENEREPINNNHKDTGKDSVMEKRFFEDVKPVSDKKKDRSIFNEINEKKTDNNKNKKKYSGDMSVNDISRSRTSERNSYRSSKSRERNRRNRYGEKKPENKWFFGTIAFFPAMIIYLEIIFHIFMEGNLTRYTFVYMALSVPIGIFLALFTLPFNEMANKIISYILTIGVCLLFAAEVVLRSIFAMYTQLFSIMDLAGQVADTNYMKVALKAIFNNFFLMILIFLPTVFIFTIGRKFFEYRRRQLVFTGVMAGCAVVLQIIAVLVVKLPWGIVDGVYSPGQLYKMDSSADEQVNKLGVLTMLRLDVKHTLFGNDSAVTGDAKVDIPELSTENNTEQSSDSEDTTSKPIDTSPNIIDIDFDSLIANESNSNIKWMHEFVSQKNFDGTYTWATKKNEYTGMFKGYNTIFITAEGFSKYCLIPELMPTLYRLSTEGFVFNNFYTALHYTSTSGGEFQNLTGMYPKNGNPVSMTETGEQGTNMYFSLARQLNRIGYTSYGYHNNVNMYGRDKSHPNLGYKWVYGDKGYKMEKSSSGKNVWPQSDLNMIEQTVGDYINSVSPFNVYYLTVSGHVLYNFTGNAQSIKNKSLVDDLPYSETTRAYIAANLELEKALASLVKKLEDTGHDKDTVIILSPDHIPYFNVDCLEELAGKTFGGEKLDYLKESDVDFDVYKNTLIIWSGSMEEPITVDKVCCQVDILPTISNLLGLEYDSRLLMGSDILSDSQGLVIFTSHSWKTDIGEYNVFSKEFTLADGLDKTIYTDEYINAYVKAMKKVVENKIAASVIFVKNDYYNSIPMFKK